VDILVEGVTDLIYVDLYVFYDPDLLEVVDADAGEDGVQIEAGTFLGTGAIVEFNVPAGAEDTDEDGDVDWEDLKPRIKALFKQEISDWPEILPTWSERMFRLHFAEKIEERCAAWKQAFGGWFHPSGAYDYCRFTWRDDALAEGTRWDNYSVKDWEKAQPRRTREDFWNSLWVHFHRAALRQRHFVLENLP